MILIDPFPFYLALIFALLMIWFTRQKQHSKAPYLFYSKVSNLKNDAVYSKTYLASWIPTLHKFALLSLLLAFINPHIALKRQISDSDHPPLQPISTEGIAIYLLLDRSGSMNESVFAVSEQGKDIVEPKMQILKRITKEFVESRPSDLIGLVAFARLAHVLAPLTLDHQAVLTPLNALQVVPERDQDGTAIGYAIFKTANLISATRHFAQELAKDKKDSSYKIYNSIMLLLTDGFQDPNPLDKDDPLRSMGIEEAAEFAKKENIKLYIVGLDPKVNEDEQYELYRKQMKRSAELTGGHYYFVTESTSLSSIYHSIDAIERKELPGQEIANLKSFQPISYHYYYLFSGLIFLALMLLGLSWLIETQLARSVP